MLSSTSPGQSERPPRICNVATKCISRDDFLRSFAPFVDDSSLFIPTNLSFELGQLVRFQVSLADGTVVLAGMGEASLLLEGPTGPLGKSGVRFLIRDVDESSRTLHDELATRRRRAVGAGVAGIGVDTGEPARLTRTIHGLAPGAGASGRPPESPALISAEAPFERPRPRPPAIPAASGGGTGVQAKAGQQSSLSVAEAGAANPPELRSPPRFDIRPEGTQDFFPQVSASPSAGIGLEDHDPFTEATLSANEPPGDEHTLGDPRAEAGVRTGDGPGFSLPRPPAEGRPDEYSPPAVQVLAAPTRAPTASSGLRTPSDKAVLRPPPIRVNRGRRFGVTVLAASAGLLLAFLIWMRANRPNEPAAPAGELNATRELAAPTPVAAAPPPRPEAEPMPSSPGPALPGSAAAPVVRAPVFEPSTAPGRKCRARIDSEPRGAMVMLGPTRLGRTPLKRTMVPCGAASVTISHPRYLPATLLLEAAPNAPVMVSARLSRPQALLKLSSTREGALFRVNGNKVGRGPRQVTLSRYESVRVDARVPGQRPWVRKIYLKDPLTEVVAVFDGPRGRRSRSR
jgi:hypothetical protein